MHERRRGTRLASHPRGLVGGLVGVEAGRDRIEHGQLCLRNRRDGVVNRPAGVILRVHGIVLRNLCVDRPLLGDDPRFQIFDVGGDFCLRGIPLLGTCIASGFNRPFRIVDSR